MIETWIINQYDFKTGTKFVIWGSIQCKFATIKNIEATIAETEREKSEFLENLIKKADLCVGTSSTGLLRQAVSLNKPIIQLFAEKHYMYDASNYIISASSEKEIKKN